MFSLAAKGLAASAVVPRPNRVRPCISPSVSPSGRHWKNAFLGYGDGYWGAAPAASFRANAWGHHASCSCAIGPRDQYGVLDSAFRVHGVQGLRVVDASVFPRIPGFFIASAVYMVGEKAADGILADAI